MWQEVDKLDPLHGPMRAIEPIVTMVGAIIPVGLDTMLQRCDASLI